MGEAGGNFDSVFQTTRQQCDPDSIAVLYVQGCGAVGQGVFAPHLLGIYLVNFGNF